MNNSVVSSTKPESGTFICKISPSQVQLIEYCKGRRQKADIYGKWWKCDLEDFHKPFYVHPDAVQVLANLAKENQTNANKASEKEDFESKNKVFINVPILNEANDLTLSRKDLIEGIKQAMAIDQS